MSEATWRVVQSEYGPWVIVNEKGQMVGAMGDGCSDQRDAKLAATAPEMARLLLELVESTDERDYYKLSPDECERITVVLRKAGVIAS